MTYKVEFPEKEIPLNVTFRSLVGITKTKYPLSFGNYCGVGKYYCCNMWAENIDEFKKRYPDIDKVKVKIFGHILVIIDEKIPKEWRNNFCITGYGGMARKYLQPLLEYCDQPLDQYICGCETDDQHPSGYISYNMETQVKRGNCGHCKKTRTL